jgi:hypothetical protein
MKLTDEGNVELSCRPTFQFPKNNLKKHGSREGRRRYITWNLKHLNTSRCMPGVCECYVSGHTKIKAVR